MKGFKASGMGFCPSHGKVAPATCTPSAARCCTTSQHSMCLSLLPACLPSPQVVEWFQQRRRQDQRRRGSGGSGGGRGSAGGSPAAEPKTDWDAEWAQE